MKLLNSLLAVALVAAGTQAAMAQWPETTRTDNGRWWMEAGAKAYDRPGNTLGLPLITNEVTNEVLFTSDQVFDLNSAAGAEIRFGSQTGWGCDWDFGMSLGGWDSSFDFVGPDLESFFFQGLDPDNVGFDYESDFYSLELNWRKPCIPGLTFTTGPRYFQLSEDLTLSTSTEFATPQGPFTFNTSDFLEVRNSAIGWQIGFEYNQPVSRDVYLQGYIRTSGMVKESTVERTTDDNVSDPVFDNRDKSSGMFIGHTGGRAYFQILPGSLHTYVGYEATWVDGVALAPVQFLNQSVIETLPTDNTVFWHAVTFGARFTY